MSEFQQQIEIASQIVQASYGLTVEWQPMPGEVEVVQASIGGREELPIYLTQSGEQTLCICYLWHDDEIDPARRTELLETMLDLNIPMPLSAFARVQGYFVVFGALARHSRPEDLAQELAALSENALEAQEVFADFLKK